MGQPLPMLAEPKEGFDPEIVQAAFAASGEGMALVEEGRICYANRTFANLLGHQDPSEVQGRQLASFRPHGHPCALMNIESSCSPFHVQDRDFLVVTVRDVCERERRRMVRDEDRRFRTIFDAAPMGIVQCDMDGRVLETNPAVQRMLGYSREELRGMHFRDFTHPEDVDKDLQLFQELVEGRRESYELELRYRGKSAATGWVRLTVALIRGVDGRPQFAIGMTEDITERKQAEQRLREAEKIEVVGRLVGGVAHDFNNLLTGITLYRDLLIARLERGTRQHHHAQEIRVAGEQGAALIQQLLAISRQQVVEPRILSLNEVIVNTRNLLSRLLGEKFALVTHFDSELGQVKIDPAQVQQIPFNLVLNARDAMAQGGSILVETGNGCICRQESTGKSRVPAVLLAVTDSGCGMSPETQSHLFEPFFTTQANRRGNGLGLATVYNIVKNNGGRIQVDSELGRGTQIRVRLPRVSDAPATGKADSSYSPTCGGETILPVEDTLAVRDAAKRILSECGYVVLEAGSGPEALAMSRQHKKPIHLLLADVVMPGMSGRELAHQLRSERPELKILYMSGYVSGYQPNTGETGDEPDPVVTFNKPFTGAALLDKLREILDVGPRKTSKKSGKRKREKP